MSRSPEYNKEYMRAYYKKAKNRKLKKLRDNDRYEYEKENWKIPKGKELWHTWGRGRWPKRVQTRKANRAAWAKTTLRVRKKPN